MFEKPSKFRAAGLAGVAMGVVSALPGLSLVNCCCCAGIIGGGVLAVYLYKQEFREEMAPLESTDGLVLGILAGLVGAFSATVISLLILLVFGRWEAEMMRQIVDKLLDSMESSGSASWICRTSALCCCASAASVSLCSRTISPRCSSICRSISREVSSAPA